MKEDIKLKASRIVKITKTAVKFDKKILNRISSKNLRKLEETFSNKFWGHCCLRAFYEKKYMERYSSNKITIQKEIDSYIGDFPLTTKPKTAETFNGVSKTIDNIFIYDKRFDGEKGYQYINPHGLHYKDINNKEIINILKAKKDIDINIENYNNKVFENKDKWFDSLKPHIEKYQECLSKLRSTELSEDCIKIFEFFGESFKIYCNTKGVYL